MGIDIKTLAAAKTYTKESLAGAGALVGKSVQVSKIEPIIGGNRVTFTYTLDNGTQRNSYLDVMNGEQGVSVVSSNIDGDGNLSFILSNGEVLQAGTITIESSKINLENYYTKEQTDKKFVQTINLNHLVLKQIEEHFIAVTKEEINNLFIKNREE